MMIENLKSNKVVSGSPEELEKRINKQRSIIGCLFALVVLSIIMNILSYIKVKDASTEVRTESIYTQYFQLLNEDGKPIVVISSSEGQPFIRMYGANTAWPRKADCVLGPYDLENFNLLFYDREGNITWDALGKE